jgi:outer membrane protein
MRNISMILNVVLVAAVGYLYYLNFKGKSSVEESTVEMPILAKSLNQSGIVFVNSDSLLDQYDYYKNKKKEFAEAQSRIKSELQQQTENLQKEFEKYQEQAAGMSDSQRGQIEEQLTMKQQKLVQRKEELLDKLDREQSNSSDELFSRLNSFFKKYNASKNYTYILGFQKGGGILFANDSLDITGQVISGLNKEYAEEEKK